MAQVAIHPGLFTLPDDPRGPRLLAARCGACGKHHFPAGDDVPVLQRATAAPSSRSARAARSACTRWSTRARPATAGPLPYGFGVVELDEGLRVVSRLTESDLALLRPGLALELEIAPLFTDEAGDEVLGFAYRPAPGGPAS